MKAIMIKINCHLMLVLFLIHASLCFGKVSVKFNSETRSTITFNKNDTKPLPFTAEFKKNSKSSIEKMTGYNFRFDMIINNSKETAWGQLFIYNETEYTKVSTVEINITQDIILKTKNGEVPIIIIRDPSEKESIICKVVFGNREVRLKGINSGNSNPGYWD